MLISKGLSPDPSSGRADLASTQRESHGWTTTAPTHHAEQHKSARHAEIPTSDDHVNLARELIAADEFSKASDHLELALMKDRGNSDAQRLHDELLLRKGLTFEQAYVY